MAAVVAWAAGMRRASKPLAGPRRALLAKVRAGADWQPRVVQVQQAVEPELASS